MKQDQAIDAFAALAQPSRMTIFRLLVCKGPDGLLAGDIARRLQIVPSTLSGHLAVMKAASLLKATRHQREIRYAANLECVTELVDFLLADCCDGQLETCAEVVPLTQNN